MTDLSPTARAMAQAFDDRYELCGPFDYNWHEVCLAAALRVLADHVVPKGPKPSANSDYHLMNWTKSLDQYYQRQQTRAEILALAAELAREPDPTTTEPHG